MTILFVLLSLAFAEPLELRVALDDRGASRYSQPSLSVGGRDVAFTDDGAVAGDVPGDGIWVTSISINRQESILVAINDPNTPLFSMAFTLPQAESVTLQLKSQEGEIPLAVDQNAPDMPTTGAKQVESLLVRAAPIVDADPPEANRQEIRFLVDDRSLNRLKEPRVRVNQSDVAMAPLVDDGRVLGDTPGDNVYHAKILVKPSEQVVFTLEDQGVVLGQVTVSLPSEKVVGAGIQIGSGGLQLLEQISAIGTSFSSIENRGSTQQGSKDLVVQAFQKDGQGPTDSVNDVPGQWLDVMLGSANQLVMPTFSVGDESVLLSDNGSSPGDIANDGVYHCRLMVARGGVVEANLTIDGNLRGKLTIFLPDSGVAQAVASITDNGLIPFDRLDVLKTNKSDVPTVFRAAGKPGTEVDVLTEEGTSLQFEVLLKGGVTSPPSIKVFAEGEELSNIVLESEEANSVWRGILELSRADIWRLEMQLDDTSIETFVIPPPNKIASLGLVWSEAGLNIMDDITLMSAASSLDEIRVLRAIETAESRVDVNSGDAVTLDVVMDDRAGKMIKTAQVSIVGSSDEPVLVFDDGLNADDESGDLIYTARLTTSYKPMIQLKFKNGSDPVVTHVVMLPAADPVRVKTLVTPAGLTSESQIADISVSAPLVVQAAPTGVDVNEGDGNNLISVTMILDDRILQKLSAPRLRVLQSDSLVFDLSDDGESADETEDDRIYSAKFQVEQAEFMKVAIDDNGQAIGEMTVFLPSSSAARIRMRTTDDAAGLKLLTEAIATGGGNAPTPIVTTGGGASGVGVDRLAHVLWVGLAMFALAFAYVRHVIHTKWTAEISPLINRLDAYLPKSESKSDSENNDA